MRIGNLNVGPGAFLAPMEAVTDLPFRTVCEELGAALTFTEFLSADALTRGASKAVSRMRPSLQGRPFVVQIFGREPAALARATEMAVDTGARVVDINMGCPAKKVTAGMCGSALMREPELAAELVATVRRAAPPEVAVTVKHRIGWDEDSINAVDFAARLVDAGAAMITVHGRTRAQGFSGQARLGPIAEVRRRLPAAIPVVGNGDVKTVAQALTMKHETGCDAVMIGRGSMGNPWVFRSLRAVEEGLPDPGPPTLLERRTIWRRHADLVREYAVERMLLHELRKTLAWYSRGLWSGAALREAAFGEKDPEALLDLGEGYFERVADYLRSGAAPPVESAHAGPVSGAAPVSDAPGLTTLPADPIAKSIARNERRSGSHVQAPERPVPSQS